MRNIKLEIQYDGSRYQGWQRLGKEESTNTLENKIIDVIKKMTNEDVSLFCGARTEVGVHAYGQIVNFKTTTDMKDYEIKHYLNRYLPMDIAVLTVKDMPERFHASLNATSKLYLYRIVISDVPSVFERKYTYYAFKKPDIELMRQAASNLVGKHDFKCFSTVKRNKSTVKEMKHIDIYGDDEEIQITLEANDFLHNMPRMIISTLLDIGLGARNIEDIEKILDVNNPVTASAPADAKGLYLQEVLY
ncbi:tRNA pseudouridine(38-40) synthase TruA [Lachnospiraceae bacterium LCP25S3_G4]